jgi:hypothetical protein
VCSLRVGLGFFVLVGLGSRGFVWWASFFLFLGCFFSISSFAFSLVYCRCTKGRLTLLIKSVYYLSKKRFRPLRKTCFGSQSTNTNKQAHRLFISFSTLIGTS